MVSTAVLLIEWNLFFNGPFTNIRRKLKHGSFWRMRQMSSSCRILLPPCRRGFEFKCVWIVCSSQQVTATRAEVTPWCCSKILSIYRPSVLDKVVVFRWLNIWCNTSEYTTGLVNFTEPATNVQKIIYTACSEMTSKTVVYCKYNFFQTV